MREIGLRDSAGQVYRFLDSDVAGGVTPCPTFTNTGVLTCASDLIRDFGAFAIGGANLPLPDPDVLSVAFNPPVVAEGGSTDVTLEVANAESIEAFFLNRPDGTFGSLPIGPFQRVGQLFTATIQVPMGTANGTWTLQEFGVFDAIDEVYRFINSGAGFGLPACPTYQNTGVFTCDSDIVRDFGSFVVGAPLTPSQVLGQLIQDIRAAAVAGDVRRGQARLLVLILRIAQFFVDQGNNTAAISWLNLFTAFTNLLVTLGQIDATVTAPLLATVADLIVTLQGP